jgi:hypothetical protein
LPALFTNHRNYQPAPGDVLGDYIEYPPGLGKKPPKPGSREYLTGNFPGCIDDISPGYFFLA